MKYTLFAACAPFLISPAFAGGLTGNYAAAGAAIGTNSNRTAGSVSGRLDSRTLGSTIPVSLRPQLTIGSATGGNVNVTYDVPVANNVNAYVGGGAGFGAGTAINTNNQVAGIAVLGVEGEVAKNVVLFTDLKFGFGSSTTYTPTVGVGYKF
jgi:opacity protein-like surface antigen